MILIFERHIRQTGKCQKELPHYPHKFYFGNEEHLGYRTYAREEKGLV
jgi:hypothetical protein